MYLLHIIPFFHLFPFILFCQTLYIPSTILVIKCIYTFNLFFLLHITSYRDNCTIELSINQTKEKAILLLSPNLIVYIIIDFWVVLVCVVKITHAPPWCPPSPVGLYKVTSTATVGFDIGATPINDVTYFPVFTPSSEVPVFPPIL